MTPPSIHPENALTAFSGSEQELARIFGELKRRVLAVQGGSGARFVLFGSRARGDHDEGSDIDIAIIVPGLTWAGKCAILDAVADVELDNDVVLATFVISTGEFERLRARERRIALDIEREGIPL